MEKYTIDNHLFFDGYSLEERDLADVNKVQILLDMINKYIFNNKGIVKMIPYFNGKIQEDGGVSGIILGDGFHFTCHTFCYKGTIFIDYFGDSKQKDDVKSIILDNFSTKDFDLGLSNDEGKFGKHIIVRPPSLSLIDASKLVEKILVEIDMNPISDLIVNKGVGENFDILQPIAESHISFHRNNNDMIVDAFSCKYFDVNKFLSLFGQDLSFDEVNRGVRWVK